MLLHGSVSEWIQCCIDFLACSEQHQVLVGMHKQERRRTAHGAAPESAVQGLPLPEEVFVTSIE